MNETSSWQHRKWNRIQTSIAFPILVASLTHREDKKIFLLCHYFARRKKRIKSNPSTSDKTNPANSQAKSRRSHYGGADNPRGNTGGEHFIVNIALWTNC